MYHESGHLLLIYVRVFAWASVGFMSVVGVGVPYAFLLKYASISFGVMERSVSWLSPVLGSYSVPSRSARNAARAAAYDLEGLVGAIAVCALEKKARQFWGQSCGSQRAVLQCPY